MDKGARLVRHDNSTQSAHDVIRSIMRNVPIPLQIQCELVDEGKEIGDTAAGGVINNELNEQIRRYRVELQSMQEEMAKALKEKDEETRQELEDERCKQQEEMNRVVTNLVSLASNYMEEKKRMDEKKNEMQERARKERDRAEAAYRQEIDDLNRQFQELSSTSIAEREAMRGQIDQLQQKWDSRPQGGCLIV